MSFAKSDSPYRVDDLSGLLSPSLLLFRELLNQNIDAMIAIAGSPARLRPHCKTHKMAEVTRIELAKGIRKHKCATFAEAQMLAEAGAKDVFLAYNPVGPNIERAVEFLRRFPDVAFAVTGDHPQAIAALSRAVSSSRPNDRGAARYRHRFPTHGNRSGRRGGRPVSADCQQSRFAARRPARVRRAGASTVA